MNKLALKCTLALGDLVVLTAIIRELKKHSFDIIPIVAQGYNELFRYSPHIRQDYDVSIIKDYPIVIDCNPMASGFYSFYKHQQHFVHFALNCIGNKLGLQLNTDELYGDLFLSEEEKCERQVKEKYWLMIAGGKFDATVKFYPHWQKVANGLINEGINVIQSQKILSRDWHPKLDNVKQIGTTNIRNFMRLIYHSEGVIAPVTSAVHIAGAFKKPCVTIAGGYEPAGWIQYENHIILNNFTCCDGLACFKKWAEKVPHGLPHQECLKKISLSGMTFPECMNNIEPERIVNAVKSLAAVRN